MNQRWRRLRIVFIISWEYHQNIDKSFNGHLHVFWFCMCLTFNSNVNCSIYYLYTIFSVLFTYFHKWSFFDGTHVPMLIVVVVVVGKFKFGPFNNNCIFVGNENKCDYFNEKHVLLNTLLIFTSIRDIHTLFMSKWNGPFIINESLMFICWFQFSARKEKKLFKSLCVANRMDLTKMRCKFFIVC